MNSEEKILIGHPPGETETDWVPMEEEEEAA